MFGSEFNYAEAYDLDSGMTFTPEPVVPAPNKPPILRAGPRWLDIRPRSIINGIPGIVFYPAVLGGAAYLLSRRGNRPLFSYRSLGIFAAGAVAWSCYNKASLDVGRVVRGEWTWDEWEKAHPILRHLWALTGRFAA